MSFNILPFVSHFVRDKTVKCFQCERKIPVSLLSWATILAYRRLVIRMTKVVHAVAISVVWMVAYRATVTEGY